MSEAKSTLLSKHKMSWAVASDGTPRVYLVQCECGWSEMTYADTPESSIGSTYKGHLS